MTATTALAPDTGTRRVPPLGAFNATLVRLELRRLLRNKRTVIFTVVMPVIFFLLFGLNKAYADDTVGRGNVAAEIMISMALYGAMIATTSSGASVSIERSLGWSRQLRLTPLNPLAYVAVKLLLALIAGGVAIIAVFIAGLVTHKAQMPLSVWILSGIIAWFGSLTFAAFGLFMGYLLPSENVMQILGPVLALLALLGGLWWPLDAHSLMGEIARFTPMYGLSQLVHAPLTQDAVKIVWVVNLVGWLVLFSAGAVWRFRKDTARV